MAPTQPIEPQFFRTRDVARLLAVSESQVRNWQRAGVLREVRIPGIRAVRFPRADVEQLANKWINAQKEHAIA